MHWVPHRWPIPYGGIQTFHSDLGIEYVCVYAASREMRPVNGVRSQSQDNRGHIRQGLVIYACQLTNLAKASHSSESRGALQLTSQSFFYLG